MDRELRLAHMLGMMFSMRAAYYAAPSIEAKRKLFLATRPAMTSLLGTAWRLEREMAAEARAKSSAVAEIVAALEPVFERVREVGAARAPVKPGCICAHAPVLHGLGGCEVKGVLHGEPYACSCLWDGRS